MPPIVSILCLANSRKPPEGRCVAGRIIEGGQFGPWIRPISPRTTHELNCQERCYRDGTDPSLLDIINIDLAFHQPHLHQQENYVIAPQTWQKCGQCDWTMLQNAVENPRGELWLNKCSSYHGRNDRVPEAQLATFQRSLYLIRVDQLALTVADESNPANPLQGQRRRVRADFEYDGSRYCLVVTDPVIEEHCFAHQQEQYQLIDAILCLSLGEVFQGYAYKLVASLITQRRVEVMHS